MSCFHIFSPTSTASTSVSSSNNFSAFEDLKTCITLATATLLIATVAAAVGTALPKLLLGRTSEKTTIKCCARVQRFNHSKNQCLSSVNSYGNEATCIHKPHYRTSIIFFLIHNKAVVPRSETAAGCRGSMRIQVKLLR